MILKRSVLVSLAVVAIAAVLSVSAAGHLAAIESVINLTPTENPVKFIPGDNAGSTDVTGGTISVSVSSNGTEATLSAHIVYGENQYIEPLNISVSKAPVTLYFVAPGGATQNSLLKTAYIDLTKSYILILSQDGSVVGSVQFSDLATGNPTPSSGLTISEDGNYSLVLTVKLRDGIALNSIPDPLALALKIYYTKSGEPPVTQR